MIQLPEKPWNEGDTFTNDTTGVEYTFDGVKWLASGAEDDGASQEQKLSLIEAQIQYRGLMELDADDKPVWPADQTRDRGGWWAYPSSKLSSIWKYENLEWIFPYAGEDFDITKKAAPEYRVGDIIQLQISDNEAGAGTSWQYFDTMPVYVEYKVEEVYYPDTQAGNENRYNPAYRVSMSGPAHRYTGSLPNVVKGPQGDASDGWIQWYPTVFAYGATVPEDAPEKEPTALGTLRWNDYSWDSGNIDSLGGVARFHPDRTKMSLNHDTSDMGRVDWGNAFGDYPAEIGISVEGKTYRAVVNFTGTAGTNSRGKNFEIVESNLPDAVTFNADVTFYDRYLEPSINIDDYATTEYVDDSIAAIDDLYVKQSESWDMELATSLGVNQLKPLDGGTPFVYYEPKDYNNTHPCGIVNRGLMENYVGEEIEKASSSEPELPKFKLVAADYSDWGNGSFAVLDSNGEDARAIDSTRTIFISAFDVDGKRWARDRDGIEYGRIFSGHINALLQNGDKTIFTMSPHYNAKCQMAYFPGNEESPHAGYLIAWQGVLSHTVTSDTSVWNVGAFYRFSIPEIFF